MVDTGVYSRSPKKSEQYWEIPAPPTDYVKKRAAEKAAQKNNPDHFDPELAAYQNREWFRRLNGFWFYNNGIPTYITGQHYFYLSHWSIDVGPPAFRWSGVQFFYFWASASEDPRCGGIVRYMPRRTGKTYELGCIAFEVATRSRNALVGIQSKSEKDAENVYWKHIIQPSLKLKDFFVPIYDRATGRAPRKKLRFFASNSRSGVDFDAEESARALNTELDYRSPYEKAYDGTKTRIIIEDEFGKLDTEYDLLERHKTIYYCVKDGGKFVGKMLYATTVEEMANGKTIAQSRELFDMSDPTDRLSNGETKSSLYRFWLPAYETLDYDKFGMPLIEQNKETLRARTDYYLTKGDHHGYASEKRKQPWCVEDIFRVSAKSPVWDITRISEQIDALSWRNKDELYHTGSLVWENGVRDTKVKFVANKNGRFGFVELMNGEQNLRFPQNRSIFVGGVDPFEQAVAVHQPSKAAAYIRKKFDPVNPDRSDMPWVQYYGRPSPNEFFEDMVKLAVYMGCQLLIENNKSQCGEYIRSRGYSPFLMWTTGKIPGIHANDRSKEVGSEMVGDDVIKNCHKYLFQELLEDMATFDMFDSHLNDRSMAWMWTVVASGNSVAVPNKGDARVIDIGQFAKKRKIR